MGTQHMTPEGAREAALLNFYRLERRAGADPLTANERMMDYAKRLDAIEAQMAADLAIIRACIEGARL